MNPYELGASFLVSLIATVIGLVVVLWIERQRRPSLSMTVGEPGKLFDNDELGRKPATWLKVQVHNRNVPRWLSWVYRGEPALGCRGWVTFHHLDGQRVVDRELIARWSESDEPKVEVFETEKGKAARLIGVQVAYDIPPGEYANLDVVYRAKPDNDCYGWNNDNYILGWENPQWRLEKGRYIARVRVKSGGREYSNAFFIANDIAYEDFRLSKIDEETKRRLRQALMQTK